MVSASARLRCLGPSVISHTRASVILSEAAALAVTLRSGNYKIQGFPILLRVLSRAPPSPDCLVLSICYFPEAVLE